MNIIVGEMFKLTFYKKFFNCFFKTYLKSGSYSYDQIIKIDLELRFFFNENLKRKKDPKKVREELCVNLSNSFKSPFDVECLVYNYQSTELSDVSNFAFEDIFNFKFCPTIKCSTEEYLSHLLFFYFKNGKLFKNTNS
jgi:hypothetical protein